MLRPRQSNSKISPKPTPMPSKSDKPKKRSHFNRKMLAMIASLFIFTVYIISRGNSNSFNNHQLITSPNTLSRHFKNKDGGYWRRQIIFSNIAIIIPSDFNQYTLQYLERLLYNIFLSQIDLDPRSNSDSTLFFPSEVIISMSINPKYYQHEQQANDLLHYYQSTILEQDAARLKIFYHHNTTMNAAQNRNFGLSKINFAISSFIGFFDIDDIMHPQRIAILHHLLNANEAQMDMIFHTFSIHKTCKEKEIGYNYLHHFEYLDVFALHSLAENIKFYEKKSCAAHYDQTTKGLAVFEIECGGHTRDKQTHIEMIEFDRFYHNKLDKMSFINFTQLIDARCASREVVKHPIFRKGLKDVACDYGTMAGGLEAFRDEHAMTRHHNGWPIMNAKYAKQLKYDEMWTLHGCYRGQDAAFNVEAYRRRANIFQFGYPLGIYCYH